jgi:hypothetical protein
MSADNDSNAVDFGVRTMKPINQRDKGLMYLPAGTRYVPFATLDHFLAKAMQPEANEAQILNLGRELGREMVDAVRAGELKVCNYLTGGPLPPDSAWPLIDCGVVAVADLRSFALSRNVALSVGKDSDVSGSVDPSTPPPSRARQREHAILRLIEQLDYTPTALPPQLKGESTLKSMVKKHLGDKGLWTGKYVFEHAWQALLRDGRIKYSRRNS